MRGGARVTLLDMRGGVFDGAVDARPHRQDDIAATIREMPLAKFTKAGRAAMMPRVPPFDEPAMRRKAWGTSSSVTMLAAAAEMRDGRNDLIFGAQGFHRR